MLACRWMQVAAATLVLVAAASAGPFDIALIPTARVPAAKGNARLVYAQSPFGIALTADGRASYDVQVTASGLPEPSSLGTFGSYIAWAATPDLSKWTRLGVITNGTTTVGQAEDNKFMLVITAEPDSVGRAKTGPIIMHGISPSSWLQAFMTHPLFRGVPQ